jgi:hypothetical protein
MKNHRNLGFIIPLLRYAALAVAQTNDFIVYAQSHPGVVFMRKDEIPRFALASPLTVREGI